MKKLFVLLALIPFIFLACDNSNEPDITAVKVEYYVENRQGIDIIYYDIESNKRIELPSNSAIVDTTFHKILYANRADRIYLYIKPVQQYLPQTYAYVTVNGELRGEYRGRYSPPVVIVVYDNQWSN